MKESLQVGVIGAGWAGSSHAVAYSRLPGVTVAGLWSRTRIRAEELAKKLDQPGLQVYDHWEDLIEQGDIGVISIAVPAILRREPITAALERGLCVLVEKPFTPGLSEARQLAQMAEKAKTVTAVSFNWRYSPGSQVAWRAVREGEIGQLLDISMNWAFHQTVELQELLKFKPWVGQSEMGGGVMREGGSHEFDRARFLTGSEFTKVVGRLPPIPIPGTNADGSYLLISELSNGSLGSFILRSTPGQGEWRTVLFGEEGTLVVTHETVVRQRQDDDEPVSLEIPEPDQVPNGVDLIQHTWNRLIADFVTAIRHGDVAHKLVPHLPTFADGLRVQEVFAAAERAEAERRWVNLAEL